MRSVLPVRRLREAIINILEKQVAASWSRVTKKKTELDNSGTGEC